MGHKHWTPKEIKYLTDKALLDSTNTVVNIKEMARYLKRSQKAVMNRIARLRKEGALPPIDLNNAIDDAKRPYSEHAIKRIKSMLNQGSTVQEIADSLGKTKSAIESLLARLRKKGIMDNRKHRYWQDSEEQYLINNIEFDEHGYTCNVESLANYLNRSVSSVTGKINKLRTNGAIKVRVDATKTSIKAKKAHDQFNNKRFAEYGGREKVVTNTPSKVEVVQIVHTVTVGPKGEEIHQYWTFDGKLLAENKEGHSAK